MHNEIVECFVGELTQFRSAHWGTSPQLFRARGQQKRYVENLLTLADADAILEAPSTRPPYVEVTRDGLAVREKLWIHRVGSKSLTIPDAVNIDALAAEFHRGATIILNHLDDYEPKNREVCDAFEAVFGATTKTVAFITPPRQQGLGAHYDTFEGFIVQTHGTKTWRVFEQVRPRPISPLGFRPGEIPGSEPVLEVTLQPGDTLYVPWGSPHFATSQDSISCHVTLMTFPIGWQEVVRAAAVSAIPAQAYDEIVNLNAEPLELLAKRAAEYLATTSAQLERESASSLLDRATAQALPVAVQQAGFLGRQEARSELGLESVICRRPGVPVSCAELPDGRLEVQVGERRFRTSGKARDVVLELTSGQEIRLADLQRLAPARAVLAVADQLLAGGAIAVARNAVSADA